MTKISKIKNGIVLTYGKITYNLPLNSLLVDADETSGTVNFRLKAYNKRNLVSIHYKEFEGIPNSTPNETVKAIQSIIYI